MTGSLHPWVGVWVLDKRELTQTDGGGGHHGSLARPSQRRMEALIDQCRHNVQEKKTSDCINRHRWFSANCFERGPLVPALQALARLKHPGVLRLIAQLEETRTQLVFITEPIFASLADLLGGPACSLPPAAAAERRELRLSGGGTSAGWHALRAGVMAWQGCYEQWAGMRFGVAGFCGCTAPALNAATPACQPSVHLTGPLPAPPVQCYAELEIKHGLLQVADTLHFLHSDGALVHKGLCPSTIIITQSGAHTGGSWRVQ